MHHSRRPHALLIAAVGATLTMGVLGILARVLHTYTAFQLDEPFATAAFAVAVLFTAAGGTAGGWLGIRGAVAENRRLRTENAELLKRQRGYEELLAAVRATDQQAEVTAVRVNKALEMLREVRTHQLADEDTQPMNSRAVHLIRGGTG